MKAFRSFLSLLLAVTMMAGTAALTACGGPDTPDIPDTPDTVQPLTLYVGTNGKADGDGSAAVPFATMEAARDYIRTLNKSKYSSITVLVGAGTYSVRSLVFDAQDSGTETCPITYRADGDVVLDAGFTMVSADFTHVTDSAVLARLSEQAQKDVVCVDLSKYGIGAADYGKIYTIGSFSTASKYDGDWTGGQYAELFYNDERMTIARYPNEGWLETGIVLAEGEGLESSTSNHRQTENWWELRNHLPDRYKISQELANRIASWQTLDGVWMFGYWMYDWADASTPIGYFDLETCELDPMFVSLYGALSDRPYYFFNVFEELDCPGEWYLDRENAVLYLYPKDDFENATVSMSLATGTVVTMNTSFVTLDGFEIRGTRSDAISVNGNNNAVQNCLIKNIGGSAIGVSGCGNFIYNNEITRTGKAGISVSGGDVTTLTRGGNVVDNNYVHDWSEVYLTYQPAITLGGCGNTASHNEICNSPHEAITYSGPYQLMQYNVIHDVCLLSSDAGAIYAGRNYTSYGCEISDNLLYNVGSKEYHARGIYTDDCLSGIVIRNNVLIDVWGHALFIGGGRDMVIENNVMARVNVPYDSGDSSGWCICYDQRGYDGATDPDSWCAPYYSQGGDVWKGIAASPYQTELWKEAFPGLAQISDDFSTVETNPLFACNPGCSIVRNNVGAGRGAINEISKKVFMFSKVDNLIFVFNPESFMPGCKSGDFTIEKSAALFKEKPYFNFIDVSVMGRQTK